MPAARIGSAGAVTEATTITPIPGRKITSNGSITSTEVTKVASGSNNKSIANSNKNNNMKIRINMNIKNNIRVNINFSSA